ncbi:MAG: hypothetical protein RIC35_17400 [Marinoscillum sp.]
MGQNIIAIYGPVAEIAKPFIELALFETGAGVLFQAVKGIISVRWGVQLAKKIGVNTASISTVTNRLVNGLGFGARNTSLTLKIGEGIWLGLQAVQLPPPKWHTISIVSR